MARAPARLMEGNLYPAQHQPLLAQVPKTFEPETERFESEGGKGRV
jgi:hypothetical protein